MAPETESAEEELSIDPFFVRKVPMEFDVSLNCVEDEA